MSDTATHWPYDLLGASTFKRVDRINCPPGEYPEVWGYDGGIENACRPLSGLRFIQEFAGNVAVITGAGGYSGSVSLVDAFPIQLRVGDTSYIDGFVYRVKDASATRGQSRIFLKWRKPGATSYQTDTAIGITTPGGAALDPRLDGLQPMSVVVTGKFAYVFIAGSEPFMFYFSTVAADPGDLVVVTNTGPGPEPELIPFGPPISSLDTNGANFTYRRSGTNSYANTTGAADPGENFINLTAPAAGQAARARAYSFSFFHTTGSGAFSPPAATHTFPNTVTNPLLSPTQFHTTGPGFYSGSAAFTSPLFEEFSAQKKLLGNTLNNVPDEATDSHYRRSVGIGVMDQHRKYGILIQLWDQLRSGRVSKVSKVMEITPKGVGEEPYRAPAFEQKVISGVGTVSGNPESALYRVAAGHRAGVVGIEIIYDATRYDTLLVYRTIADNPKGPLSLDGVFALGGFVTTNQRVSAGVNLAAPWVRAFLFTRTEESQIPSQPSFDSSAFLMEEDMPFAGAAIFHEGSILVGNIGVTDTDASGMGLVRWSSTTKQTPEVFSSLAKYSLRHAGEEVLRFVHNGPNVLAFTRQNIYLFRKEGIYMRGYHVAGGFGITNPRGACEVGSTTYFLTPSGLFTITQNGGISAQRAVQSLLVKDWLNTLDQVHLGFDQEAKCVVLFNVTRKEAALLWLETSRVTLLKDVTCSVLEDGTCPKNAATAGTLQQRACFFQQVETAVGTFRWRVFVIDNIRNKSIDFTGHPDHGLPQLTTLQPKGAEGRQVVYSTFSSGSDLKVKAAGLHATLAERLEGCRIYVAKASDSNLVGRKATILRVALGTDGGLSHTLTLDTDATQLYGLVADDDLFLSPVYCLALGWPVGVMTPEGQPYADTRDKFRERLISAIAPTFADVSGPPTLTTPGTAGGNGYSALARFAGVIYEANAASPSVRGFPAETDGTVRRSIIDKAAVIPAPIIPPVGFKGAHLCPGVETFVPNYDYQMLSYDVEGRVLEARRPQRALTGGLAQ